MSIPKLKNFERFEGNEGNAEEVFKQALEACSDDTQRFIVEVQHAIFEIIHRYRGKLSPSEIATVGIPQAFAATRITLLMRFDLPPGLIGAIALTTARSELDVMMSIIKEITADGYTGTPTNY